MRQAGTLHGVDRGTSMSQCYSKAHQGLHREGQVRYNLNTLHEVGDREYVDLEAKTIGYTGLDDQSIGLHSQDSPTCARISHTLTLLVTLIFLGTTSEVK